jgi:hypothetical protein
MRLKTGRRGLYVASIIAMLSIASGFALATVLTSTQVNEAANFYQGGNSGANGYATSGMTLSITTTPASVTSCTTGTKTDAVSAGTVTLILSSTTGGTACTTGNFAEEFVVSFSATITTQTNAFTVTTQVGSGTVASNSESVTVGTGISGAFTATVDIFVDYGSINPPTGGITVLDLVIQ